MELGLPISRFFRVYPGWESEVRLWLDCWHSEAAFRDLFPGLFELERVKNALLKDRISFNNRRAELSFNWSRQPALGSEIDDVATLQNQVHYFEFGTDTDCWKWRLGNSGTFSVGSLRIYLESLHFQDLGTSIEWNKWAPIKVNFFAWRVLNNGIPTSVAMARRGISPPDLMCPICRESEESSIHLLGTCPVASAVWDFIATWCRLPPIYFMETSDLVSLHRNYRGSKTWNKIIHFIFLTTLWAIWRHRNAVVFDGAQPSADRIIGEVKALGFLWIGSRSEFINLSWQDWISFTVPCT